MSNASFKKYYVRTLMCPTAANTQSGLTADDVEHASICLLAAAAKPAVISSALLGGSRDALAALLQLPDRQLLDDIDKVTKLKTKVLSSTFW